MGLSLVLYKFYHQRKLDLALAQLLEENTFSVPVEAIESLIQKGASPNVRIHQPAVDCPNYSEPALIFAYNSGRMDIFKLLFDKGADPNGVTSFGVTPLANALSGGDLVNAKRLLAKGANVNASDGFFGSPSIAAAGSVDAGVELLLKRGASSTINAQSPDGATALMVAAGRGNARAVSSAR